MSESFHLNELDKAALPLSANYIMADYLAKFPNLTLKMAENEAKLSSLYVNVSQLTKNDFESF